MSLKCLGTMALTLLVLLSLPAAGAAQGLRIGARLGGGRGVQVDLQVGRRFAAAPQVYEYRNSYGFSQQFGGGCYGSSTYQSGYSFPQGYSSYQGGYSFPQQGGYSFPQQGGYSFPPQTYSAYQGGYSFPQGYPAYQSAGYSFPQQGYCPGGFCPPGR